MNDQIGGTKKDIVCFVLCIHSFLLQLLETCLYTWVSYLDLNNWPYMTWCLEPSMVPAFTHSVNEK